MKDLFIVAKFTAKEMLKRKSFIISTIIIALIIILAFNIPNIMKAFEGDSNWNQKVLVVDTENIFKGQLEGLNAMELGYNFSIQNEEISSKEIKEKIEDGSIDKCFVFSTKDGKIKMEYVVENIAKDFGEVPSDIINAFEMLYSNVQMQNLGLTMEQLQTLTPDFNMEITETDENAASGNIAIMFIVCLVLFYAIFYCAMQVSTAITTEKTSKIMETLITSTEPGKIVLGKTLGIGVIGLLQVIIIITVSIVSANIFMDRQTLSMIFDISNITPLAILITVLYFILGYMLFSLIYALTGATVSKPEDIQSANAPASILSVIGFYLAYFSIMNPSSNINKIASLIPISSPFGMPTRVMLGTATMGELAASILILVATILIVAKVSIKIYSSAILNYGTKITLKDMIKIYKEK